jgi:hypothetical protein
MSLWLVIGTQALAMIIFKGSVHGYNEKGSQQDGCFCYEYGTLAIKVFCLLIFNLAVVFSSTHFRIRHVQTRETRERWPHLTVETEVRLGLSC